MASSVSWLWFILHTCHSFSTPQIISSWFAFKSCYLCLLIWWKPEKYMARDYSILSPLRYSISFRVCVMFQISMNGILNDKGFSAVNCICKRNTIPPLTWSHYFILFANGYGVFGDVSAVLWELWIVGNRFTQTTLIWLIASKCHRPELNPHCQTSAVMLFY